MSPTMAPSFTKLRAVSKKVEVKLNKLLHKLHIKKSADHETEATVEVELNNTAINTELANTTTYPELHVTSQAITNMPEPAGTSNVVNKEQGVSTKPAHTNTSIDQGTTNRPEHIMRKLKRRAPINDALDAARPHKKVRRNEQRLLEQNQAEEEGKDRSTLAGQILDKKARRAARKEARKAKWATRRTAFKAKVKKILDASITPGMITLVTVLSPVILAVGIAGFVLDVVVMVIIRVLDCLCAPVMLCIWWPFD